MAITSQLNLLHLGEFIIKDWKTSGLIKPSVIKPIITTIETMIIKRLGSLARLIYNN